MAQSFFYPLFIPLELQVKVLPGIDELHLASILNLSFDRKQVGNEICSGVCCCLCRLF